MSNVKTPILGKAVATAEQMAAYLLSQNPNPSINIPVDSFCRLFLYIGALEGVRGDLLFAQSCKETGNFKYGGTVKPNQNNYAGLGTVDVNTPGATFPDEATGILAQAQHAKGYEGTALSYECVDPRYQVLVKCGKIGSAKYWEDLGGSWAVPGYDTKKYASLEDANEAKDSYGYDIVKIFNNIIGSKGTVDEVEASVTTDLPLKGKTICIDAGHYGTYNKCPGNPEYSEAQVMWKLHLLQKKYLEELGALVVTTRDTQTKDLALHTRGTRAKGSVLFVSDHTNAVGKGMNEAVDYVAVYCLTDDASVTCDDISKDIANKLAPVIAAEMGTKQGYKVLTRLSSNDKNGDGVLNDNYYGVLNGARSVNVPGLILEHSFHTNTSVVNWLLDDANLDKLARAEAKAIAEYFSGRDVVVKEEPVTYNIHIVKSGDTLSKLAKKYNTTVNKIVEDNKNTYPKITASYIVVGWKLKV